MKSLIIKILRHFYTSILQSRVNLRFRIRVIQNGGWAGRPLNLQGAHYVVIGRNVRVKSGYRIDCYEKFSGGVFSPELVIEDGVNIQYGFTALVTDLLFIGKNSILASNVSLITENHGINPESEIPYHAQPLTTGPIRIGEGCWLGQNVCVLPNVTIGQKCVIAANAVVTSDVPDYSIAAGCPAKIIKQYNFQTHSWERVNR